MPLIHYTSCPACHAHLISPVLTAEDHTVSHERFAIWQCGQCGLRFTQDAPDAAAIGPYYRSDAYISHTNTSKGLVNRLYHLARRQTLADKYRLIVSATRTRQGQLLDIGAGVGAFASYVRNKGWDVTGLEPDETARTVARNDHNIQLLEMDHLFTLSPDSFHAITMWHVLEHVHDLHAYLDRLRELIRRSGRIFIAVPNYTSHDAAVYGEMWAAYDVPRHLYHFSPDAMRTLLAQHGLRLQYFEPMWYDSLYVSMLSEKYRHHGRGNAVKGAAIGMLSNIRAFVDKAKCSSLIYVICK